jgi:hypothetical protein
LIFFCQNKIIHQLFRKISTQWHHNHQQLEQLSLAEETIMYCTPANATTV